MIRLLNRESSAASRTRVQPAERKTLADRLIRGLLSLALAGLIRRYKQDAVDLVKIQAVAYYVRTIKTARTGLIGAVGFYCALLLLLAGFVMAHIGFFLLVGWSPGTKALVLLLMGVFYFAIALAAILFATSQRTWMHYSGAGKMVSDLTKRPGR